MNDKPNLSGLEGLRIMMKDGTVLVVKNGELQMVIEGRPLAFRRWHLVLKKFIREPRLSSDHNLR